ncbi:hypothetical protein TVAG_478890 [Trichomonas vaginalis G3]|uniref:Uncharacterized protein n=1 Tax=Trichomonas vaginalis (strain ATCC PRA-98 / G3) TaxID=412133 RepID=A2E005_TRIV3|nr:Ankyrin repeat family [Trichomonas vaginalis G3]EAY14064.1 hypothetical protein TVAG_478890 [Trichomonas vaginalis G3]KAI5519495.1 Ankyrin repeat family [Trichomonas vaginalis G3]|eukprot:XP_001326287.1 hypothetical protein [Trichomonas vaginalis G3]
MIEFLLACGANINAKDKGEGTALHDSVVESIEIDELLISFRADVNAAVDIRGAALPITADNNNKETTKFLISHGVDSTVQSIIGETADEIIAKSNNKKIYLYKAYCI